MDEAMTIIPFPHLNFRFIEKQDAPMLAGFSCTVPAEKNRQVNGRWIKGKDSHPYPYELLVQKLIHNSPLWMSETDWIRVGTDAQGHIQSYCAVHQAELGLFEIAIIAIQNSWQGRGVGRSVLADALRTARKQALKTGTEAKFIALIDVRNVRSAHLFHDFGFELVSHLPPDRRNNSYDVWSLK